MKSNNISKIVAILTIIIFTFEIILFSPEIFSQSLNRVEDNIGGSGANTTVEDSKSDNTFLYIAAGAIVIGLIVWKVILDKKEPKVKTDIKTDTTKTSLNNPSYKNFSRQDLQIEKIQNQIPVEIFFGLKNNEQGIPGKNFSLGLKIKL